MFPEQFARTQRFSLGAPGQYSVSPDGERVVFVRSLSGADPRSLLWLFEDGKERLLADGVASYGADRCVRTLAYAVKGALWTASTGGGSARHVPTLVPASDPQPSPDGRQIAYLAAGSVRIIGVDGGKDRPLLEPDAPEITYGRPAGRVAESVPMMPLGRSTGFWWSPDSEALLVLSVDTSAMRRRYIADPATPDQAPRSIPYAVAGEPLAAFGLSIITVDGRRTDVALPAHFAYLFTAAWDTAGPMVSLMTRDQRTMWIMSIDATGRCELVHERIDGAWVEPTAGTPAHTASGVPVLPTVIGDTRAISIGDVASPDGLQIREVLGTVGERVYFTASDEPTEVHVWCAENGFRRLTSTPGVHTAAVGGDTVVLDSRTATGHTVTVIRDGTPIGEIRVLTERPKVAEKPIHLVLGRRELRSRLHLPNGYRSGRLPVLLMPYSGPSRQTVTAAADRSSALHQWYADQGFAVLVTDGRGTPGRGVQWQHGVLGDRLMPVIEDQVDALHAAAQRYEALDLERVGIRGYSFGGFLSAGAVLHRPDVFRCAIAGSTPTDSRLYLPFWAERCLGQPETHAGDYERSSLITHASKLSRPLMLVYGTADDNVLPMNTLRFSAALLAAGKPHTLLPLSGQGHVARGIGVADKLLYLELAFLADALASPPTA